MELLADMLKYGQEAIAFVSGKTFEDYEADDFLRSAVESKIEIVGEASRHVSEGLKAKHPEIAWRAISAQRHVLAHEYGEIKHERIWRVATIHLPELMRSLAAIDQNSV